MKPPTFVLLIAVTASMVMPAAAPGQQDSTQLVSRRLWAGPLVDVLGAPSADGTLLSHVDWMTGDQAVRDLRTGESRHLTDKGSWWESTEFALFSVFSPQGDEIAYAWFNEDWRFDLRIVGLDGSEPRLLFSDDSVDYVQPEAWSRDGEQILASIAKMDGTNHIVLISATDGSVRSLKALDWRAPARMDLSPDGQFIVYDLEQEDDPENRDLFVLASDGSDEHRLVEHPANDFLFGWTPDGEHVLFGSDRGGTVGAWLLQVEDGEAVGEPTVVRPDMWRVWPIGFARDGSFFYSVNTSTRDVYTASMDLATGELLAAPTTVSRRNLGETFRADWSPDGRYLAYISTHGPLPGAFDRRSVTIQSVESGEARELKPELFRFGGLRWTPDGRSFLMPGQDEQHEGGLFRVDVQTGEAEALLHAGTGEQLRSHELSPDGETLFYTMMFMQQQENRLIRRELESGHEEVLHRVAAPSFQTWNAVSPDGQAVAFKRFDEGVGDRLLVMPTAGGEPRELIRFEAGGEVSLRDILWSPDGQHVLYTQSREVDPSEQMVELWRISAEGGAPHKLDLAVAGMGDIRIHPDGRRIAFDAGTSSAEVWVMQNFLPTPRVATSESRP
jgi:Tol biopolymer transport system component